MVGKRLSMGAFNPKWPLGGFRRTARSEAASARGWAPEDGDEEAPLNPAVCLQAD